MAIFSAKNTLFRIGSTASPPVYSTVGEVRSISGPSTTAEIVDITTHSVLGYWRKKLAVLIDPGEITFPMNYDPADALHAFATGLWYLMVNLLTRDMQVLFPSAAGNLTFEGQVMRHEFDAPVDNVLGVNVGISIFNSIAAVNGG